MSEERRGGLSVKEQKELYKMVHKLHTILIGNGVKGKLKEFEEKDDELAQGIKENSKAITKIRLSIAMAAGGVILLLPLMQKIIESLVK